MLKENVESINQDLLIQNHYLHSNPGYFTQRPNLFNAQRLMQALKKRNQTYNQHQDAKFLPSLPEEIKEENKRVIRQAKISLYHREKQTARVELERDWNNQLQWEKFTFANQQQYVDQHQEYLIHSMIDSSFKGRNDVQKSVKAMMKNNLNKIKDREYTARSLIRIQNDEQINKKKYLDFVKRKVLSNEDKITGIDEFERLDGEISRFWRILAEHLKSYEYGVNYQKPNPELAIIYSSIALIEAQFKQQLTSLDNEKEVSEFMRKRYITSSRENNFIINQQGVLTWAVPYAYYRAGDMTRFYIALSERGHKGAALREQFSSFHDSLNAFEPTVQRFAEDNINDIFYNQLVSIVKGYSLFEDRLCKVGSLDLIWLTLKSLKIYEKWDQSKSIEMEQVKQALQQHFSLNQDKYLTKEASIIPYLQFLYLAKYQSIVWLKKKQKISHGLTEQDYIHFLLFLKSNPQIMSSDQNEVIQKALEEQLITYLSILLDERDFKEYAIFYLLQIPQSSFSNVVLSVFNSWQKFDSIDHCFVDGFKGWKYVKFRYAFDLNSELFEEVIRNLYRRLLQVEQKPETQMKIVHSAQQILNNVSNFMDMVFECQCKHLLKLKNDKQLSSYSLNGQLQKKKAQQKATYRQLNNILKETLEKDQDILKQYEQVTEFLECYCRLEDIMYEKNIKKIEEFLNTEKYISGLPSLLSKKPNKYQDIFDKLSDLGVLELFFIYIKNVVYSKEKILYMRGNFTNLEDFKASIANCLHSVQKEGIYDIKKFKKYYDF